MATTQQKAAPQKKSEGFTGVRGAFWIIVVCAINLDSKETIHIERGERIAQLVIQQVPDLHHCLGRSA